ncbi:MAG TPA: DUF3098 domain-containing protein [Chitinophagaceae bacterium]|nr:DUF3098 domain-containing protein [Chitinophagaceae bacterium]
MADNNKKTPARGLNSKKEEKNKIFPFTKSNYLFMIVGLVVIIIGYLLMIGGKSPNLNEFHPNQIYSFRRITLSPIVIIIGVLIEIYAIMKKPKTEESH